MKKYIDKEDEGKNFQINSLNNQMETLQIHLTKATKVSKENKVNYDESLNKMMTFSRAIADKANSTINDLKKKAVEICANFSDFKLKVKYYYSFIKFYLVSKNVFSIYLL